MRHLFASAATAALLIATPALAQTQSMPQSESTPTTVPVPKSGAAQMNQSQNAATNPGTANMASQNLSAADRGFVKSAAEGGLAEVQLGQLAAENGQSDDVRSFGQRMADDHSKLNDQLKTIASQDNITLPSEPDRHQRTSYKKLSSLKGSNFDRHYIRLMVRAHEHDLKAFQQEASTTQDSGLRDFATQGTSVIADHLKMVRELSQNQVSSNQ